MTITTIKFSVNNWDHLYSLEQAILNNEKNTGKLLSITGTIRNADILDNENINTHISFKQSDHFPEYAQTEIGQVILGQMTRLADRLECSLNVNEKVFEELRKNLMEYADIDGIHIIVTIGLITEKNNWPVNTMYPIIKLDYAMKGDT